MSATTEFSYANYLQQEDISNMTSSLLDDGLDLPWGNDLDFLNAPLDSVTDDQLFEKFTTATADSTINEASIANSAQEPLSIDPTPYTADYNPYFQDNVRPSSQIPQPASNTTFSAATTDWASSNTTPTSATTVTADIVNSDPFEDLSSLQTVNYDDFLNFPTFENALGPDFMNGDAFGAFETPKVPANTPNIPSTSQADIPPFVPPNAEAATAAPSTAAPSPAAPQSNATNAPNNPVVDLTDAEWATYLNPDGHSSTIPAQKQRKPKSYESPTVTDEFEEAYYAPPSVYFQHKQRSYYTPSASDASESSYYAAMSGQIQSNQRRHASPIAIVAYGMPVYAAPTPQVQRNPQSHRSPAVTSSYNAPYYGATEMPAAPYSTHPRTPSPQKRRAPSSSTPPPAPKKQRKESHTAASRPVAQPGKRRRAVASVDPRALEMYGLPVKNNAWPATGASASTFHGATTPTPVDPALSYASSSSANTPTPQSTATAAFISPSPANTPASHASAPPAYTSTPAYQQSPPAYTSPTTGHIQTGSSLPIAVEDILDGISRPAGMSPAAFKEIMNSYSPSSSHRRTPSTSQAAPYPPQQSSTPLTNVRQVKTLSEITHDNMPPSHVEGMKYGSMDAERWAKLMKSASLHNGHVRLVSGHWARLEKREDGIMNLVLVMDG